MTSGGCPHAAIREDISANLHALEELQEAFSTEMLFVESGGDNLAGASRVHLTTIDFISQLLERVGRLHHLRD